MSFLITACTTPHETATAPHYEDLPSDTGVVVDTAGDTVTVLIGQKLVTIRLEGFAEDGAQIAEAVRRSPAHARYASGAAIAAH